MVIKQPRKRIIILILLLSLVLFSGHVHHHPEAGTEGHCLLCILINTGFVLAAAVDFEIGYIILGILAFISYPVVLNQRRLQYLMRAPPVTSTGS